MSHLPCAFFLVIELYCYNGKLMLGQWFFLESLVNNIQMSTMLQYFVGKSEWSRKMLGVTIHSRMTAQIKSSLLVFQKVFTWKYFHFFQKYHIICKCSEREHLKLIGKAYSQLSFCWTISNLHLIEKLKYVKNNVKTAPMYSN